MTSPSNGRLKLRGQNDKIGSIIPSQMITTNTYFLCKFWDIKKSKITVILEIKF